MYDRLPEIYLPDFVSKKIDMLDAANMFKEAIDKIAIKMGMDPEWETLIKTYQDYQGEGNSNKVIAVGFEAGPHDWGVSYSLGAYPKSYKMHDNIQDWYLECYYGFDVLFTPHEFEGAKEYNTIKIKNVDPTVTVGNYVIKEVV
jgi:hypothetical protein